MKPTSKTDSIPPGLLAEAELAVNNNPHIKALLKLKNRLTMEGKIVEAINTAKAIDIATRNLISERLRELERQKEEFTTLNLDMPVEERDRFSIYLSAIIFLCDLIETFQMDADQLMRKYYPDKRLASFDKLKALSAEAKNHVMYMGGITDDRYLSKFGDTADNLYTMVFNKAKSFITKMRKV